MNDQFFMAQKALIKKDKEFLVMLHSKLAKTFPSHWDFPGGKLDAGESLEEGLIREVKEETSLSIQPERMISSFFDDSTGENYIFLVWDCKSTSTDVKLSIEHDDYKWLTKDEILALPHVPFIAKLLGGSS